MRKSIASNETYDAKETQASHDLGGNIDQATAWLAKAFDERPDHLVHLGRDPITDPVRFYQKFKALIQCLGLPQ